MLCISDDDGPVASAARKGPTMPSKADLALAAKLPHKVIGATLLRLLIQIIVLQLGDRVRLMLVLIVCLCVYINYSRACDQEARLYEEDSDDDGKVFLLILQYFKVLNCSGYNFIYKFFGCCLKSLYFFFCSIVTTCIFRHAEDVGPAASSVTSSTINDGNAPLGGNMSGLSATSGGESMLLSTAATVGRGTEGEGGGNVKLQREEWMLTPGERMPFGGKSFLSYFSLANSKREK